MRVERIIENSSSATIEIDNNKERRRKENATLLCLALAYIKISLFKRGKMKEKPCSKNEKNNLKKSPMRRVSLNWKKRILYDGIGLKWNKNPFEKSILLRKCLLHI